MSKQEAQEAAILGMFDDFAPIEEEVENTEAKATDAEPTKTNEKLAEKQQVKPRGYSAETQTEECLYIKTEECRPWDFADRDESEMGNIEELANAIRVNGQTVPGLVRLNKNTKNKHKYEVIYGHRRWLACKLAGVNFRAVLKKDLNDKDAAAAQKEENENRRNLSAYSKAKSYRKLLDSKAFSSERELSTKLNIPTSTLNRIMAFNKLDTKILKSFTNIHDFSHTNAEKLLKITKNLNEAEIERVCALLPQIESGTLPIDKLPKVLKKELDQIPKDELTQSSKRKFFKNKMGVKLFSSGINHNGSHTITFHKIILDNDLIEEVEQRIHELLMNKTDSIKIED